MYAGGPWNPSAFFRGGKGGTPIHRNKLGWVHVVPEVENEILAAISTACCSQYHEGGQASSPPVSFCPAVLQLPLDRRAALAGCMS